ncbi:MAG: N-acetylmuramoyl-L-alanine amidase [Rhodocyclaceae bacterium]|nr:N-acetylmuramoyl-L-alanine amidase [Rhodocyclaceae bacterium]MBX3670272.1 N-acetylmuramoyl-L-alanine amidase [Rhodocyclaceae bacterium]
MTFRRQAQRAAAALLLALGACAPLAPQPPGRAEWYPSPNFDTRRPTLVVLHHTGSDSAAHALGVLTDPAREVSAHYLIARSGKLYQLVDETRRAWHAGVSWWDGSADVNSRSLGIELDNDGTEPFSEPQIATLIELLADLKLRYLIPAANFVGHADVAPRRKADPSRHFPWRRLASLGYGLWCDAPPAADLAFDPEAGLRALGYDTGDVDAAAHAFRLHYRQTDDAADLDETDRALLQCLANQKNSAAAP